MYSILLLIFINSILMYNNTMRIGFEELSQYLVAHPTNRKWVITPVINDNNSILMIVY